ncbi:MAG: 4-hydroxy-tetrahydrodipicolinate synthase [Peptoniphilaceae bacterium]|nr:4-hydroxy-tetrahydrodipicolinate synthase [Peptoniphilaceae bacterium]MDD7383658.1 4-hydroxy-tetrahydrodipicolinate synthase [Peptoniphilaceae bacterium]MDY3737829.1 4-hydroxy-tetrahydrodipicolinate synthase [Peptoniphilaceae bacterium]
MLFEGSAVAIVTPFNEDLTVDYESYENLIDFHLKNKTDAIVACGTTSEASTLTKEEKLKLINITIEKCKGKIPVIVGTGSNNTLESANFSKEVSAINGVDALLVVTPYYNKATQNGLYYHFKTIAEYSQKPIILYNVPSRTNVNIDVKTVVELSRIENIIAIKDATADLNYTLKLRNEVDDNFAIYSGNDNIILPMVASGANGVISVLANIFPNVSHDICSEFFKGNIQKSKELQLKYQNLINDLFNEVNPVPVKSAMEMLGLCNEFVRLPLSISNSDTKEKLKNDLEKLNLKVKND